MVMVSHLFLHNQALDTKNKTNKQKAIIKQNLPVKGLRVILKILDIIAGFVTPAAEDC